MTPFGFYAQGMPDSNTPIQPNGRCFCGCTKKPGYGRFFVQGHDKVAEAAFLAIHHGGTVAQMLADHGYGPDNPVTAAAIERGGWENCPTANCDYVGAPASIRTHLNRYHSKKET